MSTGYAENSAFLKKEDRLKDALGFATSFYRKYPNSAYTGKVKKIEAEAKEELASHALLQKEYAERLAEQKAKDLELENKPLEKVEIK